jgi:hypothetical protein
MALSTSLNLMDAVDAFEMSDKEDKEDEDKEDEDKEDEDNDGNASELGSIPAAMTAASFVGNGHGAD